MSGLLPSHRSMSEAEIALMNNMRKAGISTSQVYAFLASQRGGFDKLNYGLRDMYNQIAKKRHEIPDDVGRALNMLDEMASKDKCLYYGDLRETDGREFYAEYETAHGVPVMQTCIEPLEMCAAGIYTQEVFLIFRLILVRAGAMRVFDGQTRDDAITFVSMPSQEIYGQLSR
ncbi:hypothetical protein PIB30_043146 [Stylosanthes scabra]|uniref:Uncharacterized protein n=1 Tax=Stylosanthes scabra TaxID=79078 RepID=A0ABU6YE90_9FABA|nr:hypothetical protein [Stylosanthes scabra]